MTDPATGDRLKDELHSSERLFRILVEGVRDYAIILLDPAGHIRSWNPGAQRIKGFEAAEIIGQHMSRLYPEADALAQKPQWELQTALAEGRFEEEGWRVRKDGSMFWANVILSPVHDDSGRHLGFAKITRDISARKQAEEKLREALERAERASRAKSDFLASMSHELRTPLNAVIGFAQVLQLENGSMSARQVEFTGHILDAGRQLLALIDEVLDLTRIENGSAGIAHERVDLAPLLQEVATTMAPMAAARSIALAMEPLPRELPAARAQRGRLLQVLLNLASNAIKYNRPHGSVRVDVRAAGPGLLRLSFVDTGIGVPRDRESELFEPFSRLGREHSGIAGVGLGLAISRRMMELMGGNIGYSRPTEGPGSCFWIELPAA